jgi:hypothetical protein
LARAGETSGTVGGLAIRQIGDLVAAREPRPQLVVLKAAQQWTFDALWPVLDRITARKVFIPCGFSSFYEPAYSEYFIQLPEVLRKFGHLIFYANEYRDIDFARAHGLTNISVLPNGASELEFGRPPDPAFRVRLGIPDDDFVFLTVGSPISMKGHKAVAEAFAKVILNGRSATLILNGNWPEPPTLGRAWRLMQRMAFILRSSIKVLREEGWAGLKMRIRCTVARWRQRKEKTIEDWIKEARAQPGKRVVCSNLPRRQTQRGRPTYRGAIACHVKWRSQAVLASFPSRISSWGSFMHRCISRPRSFFGAGLRGDPRRNATTRKTVKTESSLDATAGA